MLMAIFAFATANAQTFAEIKAKAQKGDAEAQYELGECYAWARGVTQDYPQALYWYRKAAEQGYAKAQCELGKCYAWARGVTQDYPQALYWYRKAAEQGHAESQWLLGDCYADGNGVTKDITQAAYWYRKAAEQGHAEAQYELGKCYRWGDGVAKDNTQALYWYRKAADGGSFVAKAMLKDLEGTTTSSSQTAGSEETILGMWIENEIGEIDVWSVGFSYSIKFVKESNEYIAKLSFGYMGDCIFTYTFDGTNGKLTKKDSGNLAKSFKDEYRFSKWNNGNRYYITIYKLRNNEDVVFK